MHEENSKKKSNIKEIAKKTTAAAKKAAEGAKTFVSEKAMPAIKQASEDVKEYTETKVIPKVKETTEKTKTVVKKTAQKITEKKDEVLTEEKVQEILNTLYIKSINGIPKVSLPIEDLVDDYMKKNPDIESAVKSLIKNSTIKCGTSGFLTSSGGFAAMIAALPANITSVLYVQLRMSCAIAAMGGYDIHSDQVQTLIFACLTGSAMTDILKQAGVRFGTKFTTAMIKKIPVAALTKINKAVGFRFVTKFGTTGIINLGKLVPVLGGIIGGGVDVASTVTIGNNAYKVFIKNEMPTGEEDDLIIEADFTEKTDDIDDLMLSAISQEDSHETKQSLIEETIEDRIRKVNHLHDQGLIDDETFNDKIRKLISEI